MSADFPSIDLPFKGDGDKDEWALGTREGPSSFLKAALSTSVDSSNHQRGRARPESQRGLHCGHALHCCNNNVSNESESVLSAGSVAGPVGSI